MLTPNCLRDHYTKCVTILNCTHKCLRCKNQLIETEFFLFFEVSEELKEKFYLRSVNGGVLIP